MFYTWIVLLKSVISAITITKYYPCYADDTQLFLSFPSSDKALIATRISECLADVSTWTTANHLRLNLNKTELLLIPGKDCPHMELLVTVENVTIYFSNCRKSRCGIGQSVMLHGKHHCAGPILQICTLQHPQNPALPHKGSSSASSPITGHLPPRLLQLTPGWTSCLCD